MGMTGGVGGGPEPVALRSTASQMQRGSGELQSTPTGFWKLQSDPAGAGHGSIAAGIGALTFLRPASLTAHMGCSHTLHKLVDNVQTQKTQSREEDGVLLVDPPVNQECERPVS